MSNLLFLQAGVLLLLVGTIGLLGRAYLIGFSFDSQAKTNLLRIYDTGIGFLFLAIILVLTLFAFRIIRKLAFPIGRMLHKTQDLVGYSFPKNMLYKYPLSVANPDYESIQELTELEQALDDIKKTLQTQVESLKKEREEQAILMGAISDAILAIDVHEYPLFYNSRFAVIFGLSPKASKKNLSEITENQEIKAAFQRSLQRGTFESIHALPLELVSERRFFSVSVSPLRNEDEEIYGAVGIFHDVTELKLTEQIRIDFVANVSHELRTPLTAIRGYAETLFSDIHSGLPITPEFLETIIRNSDRLMALVHDLLDLSSIESTDTLQRTALSTQEISEKASSQLENALSKRGQTLHIEIGAKKILADPKRLEQIVVNLLDNASKYTPEGSEIFLRWKEFRPLESGTKNPSGSSTPRFPVQSRDGHCEEKTAGILLQVSDNGPGIPPEHQPRLFERFYRVDKARSRESGGTGLGLAIVKHIVQKHGGSIELESAPGKGSTFSCYFPKA